MEIQGKVFYLDRVNVDTDQIIPAKYLTGVSISGLGPFLFEGVPGFDRENPEFKEATILVAGENFGCGSSREHAVWALEANGFRAVIASSFARIFRQNMFNRGLLAIELSADTVRKIFHDKWPSCVVDFSNMVLRFFLQAGYPYTTKEYPFQLTDFDKTLVLQRGLVGFVARNY